MGEGKKRLSGSRGEREREIDRGEGGVERKEKQASKQVRESDRDRSQERRRRRWGGDWQGRQSERGQREGDFESVRQTRETELVR